VPRLQYVGRPLRPQSDEVAAAATDALELLSFSCELHGVGDSTRQRITSIAERDFKYLVRWHESERHRSRRRWQTYRAVEPTTKSIAELSTTTVRSSRALRATLPSRERQSHMHAETFTVASCGIYVRANRSSAQRIGQTV
jgi:hypothetical protein